MALDAYVLAGVSFGWAARKDRMVSYRKIPLLILPAVPLFVLATIYGLEVTSRAPYVYLSALSVAAGIAYVLSVWRRGVAFCVRLLSMHLVFWVPMVCFAAQGELRWLVYWGLTCLYLLVALSFRGLVQRDRIGGWVIVAGFVFWAMCFLVHPLVRSKPEWNAMVTAIWNLQKYFVILGMVLALLEEQTRRRQEEAMHDPLTSLPNRRLFDDRLAQALERSRRTGSSMALFILDLNGFKEVNDTHGHLTGDMVLVRVADALRTKVRSSDTLARFGGDEFSVIVQDLTRREDCERIVDALRSAVEEVVSPSGDRSHLTASVGYAMFPQDAMEAISLCEVADLNMYGNKSRRRSVAVTV